MRTPSALVLVLVVAAAMAAILPSDADAQGRLRGMMRLGGDHGGEKVLEFEYQDGSTPDVTAGGGLLFTAGGVYEAYRSRGHGVDAQLNAGVKYRTIPPATNQDANWLRFPVEALVFYRAPAGLRIGGGTAVHLANKFSASGDAANGSVHFDAKPGVLLQADYAWKELSFDLRYTGMTYQTSTGAPVGASSIGGGISYFFGRRG